MREPSEYIVALIALFFVSLAGWQFSLYAQQPTLAALSAQTNELAAAGSTVSGTFATSSLSQVFNAPYKNAPSGTVTLSGTISGASNVVVALVPATYAGKTDLTSVSSYVHANPSVAHISSTVNASGGKWSVSFASTSAAAYNGLLYPGSGTQTLLADVAITIANPQSAGVPSCAVYAVPSSIKLGDQVLLTWKSTNAVSAQWEQNDSGSYLGLPVDSVPMSGTQSVATDGIWDGFTFDLALDVTSPSGITATCGASIAIIPPPICTMLANGSSNETDSAESSVHVSWTSINASSATDFNGNAVDVNGSTVVDASATPVYGVTFDGVGGESVCGITIRPSRYHLTPMRGDPRGD